MRIEFIAIGSEMLSLDRVESNSLYLQDELRSLGIHLASKTVISDDKEDIKKTVQDAMQRSEIIIISGGLGPTVDDLTVKSLADLLKRKVVLNEKTWKKIEGKLSELHRIPNDGHRKQAFVVDNAEILENKMGEAPGEYIRENSRHLFLLPGVPHEFKSLAKDSILPILKEIIQPAAVLNRLIYKFSAIPESELDLRIKNKLSHLIPSEGEEFIITTKPGVQTVAIITNLTGKKLEDRKNNLEKAFNDEFKDNFYATGELLLEEKVSELLTAKALKLAVAESCTGGLLASKITDIPGASIFFLEGLVTYDNQAKIKLLGVSQKTLEEHGAVSKQTALEMCSGLLERSGADITLSITGIAGPDGGTKEKPVGTVFIGVADKFGTIIEEKNILGTRRFFKEWVSSVALNMIRLRIIRHH